MVLFIDSYKIFASILVHYLMEFGTGDTGLGQ
jgi:hypothetical protein